MKAISPLLVGILGCLGLATNLPAQKWVKDPTFNPQVTTTRSVDDRVEVDSYDDGYFVRHQTHVNGAPAKDLIRLDITGTLDSTFDSEIPVNNRIQDIAALPDGSCWVLLQEISSPAFDPFPTDQEVVIEFPIGESPPPVGSLIKLRPDGSRDPDITALNVNLPANLYPLGDRGVVVQSSFANEGNGWINQLQRITADGQINPKFAPVAQGTWDTNETVVTPDGRIYLRSFSYFQTPTTNAAITTIPLRLRTVRLLETGQIDSSFALTESAESFRGLIPTSTGIAMHSGEVVYKFNLDGERVSNQRIFPSLNPTLPFPTEVGIIQRLVATHSDQMIVATSNLIRQEIRYGSALTLSADGSILTDAQDQFTDLTDIQLRATTPSGYSLSRTMPALRPQPYAYEPRQWPDSHQPHWAISDGMQFSELQLNFESRSAGRILRLFEDSIGRILAWGDFDFIDSMPRPGIARFMPDGSLDASFNPPAVGILLPLNNGGAIVRQWEPSTDPETGGIVAIQQTKKLQPDGSFDPNFNLPESHHSPATNWLAEYDNSDLLISSYTETTSTGVKSSIVRLAANGTELNRLPTNFEKEHTATIAIGDLYPVVTITPFGYPHPSNPIQSARPLGSGETMIKGSFDTVQGLPRHGLVRLTAQGELDLEYNREGNSFYRATLLADGSAIVNDYDQSTAPSQRLIKFGPDGNVSHSFQPPYANGVYRELSDGRLFGLSGLRDTEGWPDLGLPSDTISNFGQFNFGLLDKSRSLWIVTAGKQSPNAPVPPALIRFHQRDISGTLQPDQSASVTAGSPAWFHFKMGSAGPHAIKWFRNGIEIPGETTTRLLITQSSLSDAGTYHAEISYGGETLTTDPQTLTVDANTARLVNFSARSYVTSEHPQILGFVPIIDAGRPFLIRALGWSLASVRPDNETALLSEPFLRLHRDGGNVIARDIGSALDENIEQLSIRLGAFPARPYGPFYLPERNYGSALSVLLGQSPHTASVTSLWGEPGLSLLELYDASDDARRGLNNFSIRGRADEGSKVLTAGFVINGEGPAQIMLRAIGPSLSDYHVTAPAPDPTIRLFSGSREITANTDWQGDPEIVAAAQAAGAFAIEPDSLDAAILVNLIPGVYSAHVDVNAEPGEVLLEVYHLSTD